MNELDNLVLLGSILSLLSGGSAAALLGNNVLLGALMTLSFYLILDRILAKILTGSFYGTSEEMLAKE